MDALRERCNAAVVGEAVVEKVTVAKRGCALSARSASLSQDEWSRPTLSGELGTSLPRASSRELCQATAAELSSPGTIGCFVAGMWLVVANR